MRYQYAVFYFDGRDSYWRLTYMAPRGRVNQPIVEAKQLAQFDMLMFFDQLGNDGWRFCGTAEVGGPNNQPEMIFARAY